MSSRLVLQSGAVAAFSAALLLGAQVVIGIGIGDEIALLSSSVEPARMGSFFRIDARAMMQLMAADDAFAIAYAVAFVVLALYLMQRVRVLATVALVLALLTALTDLTENSLTLAAVQLVVQNQPLDANLLVGLFWLGQMKYLAIYLAGVLFAVGLCETGRAGKVFAGLLLLFPVIGLGSIAVEALVIGKLLWMFVLLLAGGIFLLKVAQSQ